MTLTANSSPFSVEDSDPRPRTTRAPAPAAAATPTITAVLVAHDGAPWLPRALAALAAQTRLPDRVLAVDTGSRDETPGLLRRVAGPRPGRHDRP